MERAQLNVRLDKELMEKIDRKRIQIANEFGTIPTRSDILRLALDAFLTAETDVTGKTQN